jgi:small GTP-binding protein
MPREVKVVLLGNSGVGKTCIAERASAGAFPVSSEPTTISSEVAVSVAAAGGGLERLSVCDTSGQDCFRGHLPLFLRGALGALIVFDVMERASFTAVPGWVALVCKTVLHCRIVLVGNKADLGDDPAVSAAEAEAMRGRIGASFYREVSARTGENIEALFADVARLVMSSGGPAPVTMSGNCC